MLSRVCSWGEASFLFYFFTRLVLYILSESLISRICKGSLGVISWLSKFLFYWAGFSIEFIEELDF